MIMRYILILLMLCQTVLATTYYVDWATGSDTNNGTSTATPWKRSPGMATATGTAKTTVLVSGDIVAFKGGSTHLFDAAIVAKSGVTYDGELWGTGTATIDRQNTPGTGIAVGTASNVIIKRLAFQNIGGYSEDNPIWDGISIASVDIGTDTFTSATNHNLVVGDDVMWTSDATLPAPLTDGRRLERYFYVISVPTPTTFTVSLTAGGPVLDITDTGSGTIKVWEPVNPGPDGVGISAYGSTNLLVEDVTFNEIGQWQRIPPMRGVASVNGSGVKMIDANGVTLRRVTIRKTAMGVVIQADNTAVENILIDDCDMAEYMRWGIDINPKKSNKIIRNITIQNTRIHDYHHFDSGNWQSFGEKPHTNGIMMRNSSATGVLWENVLVNACQFYADTELNGSGGTAGIYLTSGPSAMITNCVFYRIRNNAAIKIDYANQSVNQQVVRIYNNAFLNVGRAIYDRGTPNPLRKAVHIANNMIIRGGAANDILIMNDGTLPFATLNHNLYFSPNMSVTEKFIAYFASGGGYRKLSQVQAAGFESNGAWGNPLWPVQTGNFANIDWTIPADSPAVSAGANLSEFFTKDALGNTRPATGAWDLGPYVSGVAPPADTTPPTLTGREVDATGKVLTLTFSEAVEGVATAHYSMSGYTLSGAAGSGQTWTMAISPAVQTGTTVSLGYTSGAGRSRDLAGNLLATGTFSVVNGSLETTPDPPRPGRRGQGSRQLIRR